MEPSYGDLKFLVLVPVLVPLVGKLLILLQFDVFLAVQGELCGSKGLF